MLAVLCAALMVSGCSTSYNGERLFWKAERVSTTALSDPAHASPEQFEQVRTAFGLVTQRVPGTVWAARAQMAIGSLYAFQKRYDEAREAYAVVLREHHEREQFCRNARLAIATLDELEGRWDDAVKMYYELAEFHPFSQAGLEAPLYVAALYEKRGQSDQATKAYQHALVTYTELIPKTTTPEMSLQVKSYLALAYERLGEWDGAIDLLEELARAPSGVNRPLVLLTLGSIYQAKLQDDARARHSYARLLEEFPEHPFGKIAKTKLEHLALTVVPSPASSQESPALIPSP